MYVCMYVHVCVCVRYVLCIYVEVFGLWPGVNFYTFLIRLCIVGIFSNNLVGPEKGRFVFVLATHVW